MPKKRYKKDGWANRIYNAKSTYLIILAGIIVYSFCDDRILNAPAYFFWIRYAACICLFILFFVWRFKKYNEYYRRKFNHWVYKTALIICVAVFSLIFQGILNVPFLLYLRMQAKDNPIEYFDCDVSNVITIKVDKIHFLFKDRVYSEYFSTGGLEREAVLKNYRLQIGVRKSDFGAYYLEEMNLIPIPR